MKNSFYFLFLTVLFGFNSQAFAATKSVFPIGQPMAILILQTPTMGEQDQDADRLYADMDVPPKDSFLGPGKTIEFGEKIMSLVCAMRGANLYTCTLILHGSPVTQISPENKSAKFYVTGENAEKLLNLFHANDGEGNYSYKTTDGKLIIKATKQEFFISYQN